MASATFLFIFESYNSGKTEMDEKAVIARANNVLHGLAYSSYFSWHQLEYNTFCFHFSY
jgi:hypothetical protein